MKKLLLTCALVGAVTAGAFAQGTVQFSNTALQRMSLQDGATRIQIPLTENIFFGLWYGQTSTSLQMLTQLGVNSSSTAGLIANPSDRKTSMTAVQLPGTSAGQNDIWIQVKAWDGEFGTDWIGAQAGGRWWGQTDVIDVGALGPSTGPGLAIWQSSAGASLIQMKAFALTPVPEPSMMALAGLGLASLLIFRRRS